MKIMKIDVKKGMLEIQVDEYIANLTTKKVKSTVRKHESCEERNEFYYLPVLADPETRKRLANTELPSCVEVSLGSVTVPLKRLKDDLYNLWARVVRNWATPTLHQSVCQIPLVLV